jgi:hypothetical protein
MSEVPLDAPSRLSRGAERGHMSDRHSNRF